jgi:type IV pilus assembly protein PilA
MKSQMQTGFTLIELMIVVAIIGILAAVAIPAYQDYTQRAQVSEVLTMTSGAKTAIAEYAQSNGAYPATADLADIGLGGNPAIDGSYASAAIGDGNGVITVSMKAAGVAGADVGSKDVTLTPPDLAGLTGSFKWTCASATIPEKLLPKGCSYTGT